jgi:hypothetical protein
VVAHQSSCSWPLRAMMARHEVGKMKESSPGFSSDLLRSLYDGGGAAAQDGNGMGMMRTMRRRVRGGGIFIMGRVMFYRAEVTWGRSGAFNGWR